jgi:hypothetical protein
LAELLAFALDECLDKMALELGVTIVGNTQVDTLDGKTIIMLPVAIGSGDVSKRYDIIFNDNLNSMYGFLTTPHPTIPNAHIVRRTGNEQQLTIGYTPKTYSILSEVYKSSKQFPFKTISFSSRDIPVEPLKRYNNADNENNASAPIITDLLLQVDNIAEFYDALVYQPQSYGRKIMLNTNNISNKTDIVPFLETDDGLQAPLYVPPHGSCGILIQFTGSPN